MRGARRVFIARVRQPLVAGGATVSAVHASVALSPFPADIPSGTVVDATGTPIALSAAQAEVLLGVAVLAESASTGLSAAQNEVLLGVSVPAQGASTGLTASQAQVLSGVSVNVPLSPLATTVSQAQVLVGTLVGAAPSSLRVTPNSSVVQAGSSVTAIAKALNLTPGQAQVLVGVLVDAAASSLVVSPAQASVSSGSSVDASTRELGIGPQQASVLSGVTVGAAAGSLALNSPQHSVLQATQVAAGTASISIAAAQATVVQGSAVFPVAASISLSSGSTEILAGVRVLASPRQVALTPAQAQVLSGVLVSAQPETFALTLEQAQVVVGTAVLAGATSIQMSALQAAITATENASGITMTTQPYAADVTPTMVRVSSTAEVEIGGYKLRVVVVPTGETPPSLPEVLTWQKAGGGLPAGSGFAAPVASGQEAVIAATGLEPETDYTGYGLVTNEQNNRVSGHPWTFTFTTPADPVPAPTPAKRMKISEIISTVREALHDEVAEYHWSDKSLLRFLNAALREVTIHRPDATSDYRTHNCVAGSRQTLAPDLARLIDIPRNTAGGVVKPIDSNILDTRVPGWQSQPPGDLVEHFIYDTRVPTTFWVYPPAPDGLSLDVIVSKSPDYIVSTQVDLSDIADDVLEVSDLYINPIQDYMCYRAYMRDSDHAGNVERANAFLQSMATTLGIKTQNDAAISGGTRTR